MLFRSKKQKHRFKQKRTKQSIEGLRLVVFVFSLVFQRCKPSVNWVTKIRQSVIIPLKHDKSDFVSVKRFWQTKMLMLLLQQNSAESTHSRCAAKNGGV